MKRVVTRADCYRHIIFLAIYGSVKYLPLPIGDKLRYLIVNIFSKKIGNVRIYEGVTIWYPYRLSIGNNVTLNEWVYISAFGDVEIENNVRIGHRTSILSSEHVFSNMKIPIYKQGLTANKVIIERDAYIGCNVTILKGVKIGRGSVIGAGSVVTKDIPPYSIAVGNPARIIKKR